MSIKLIKNNIVLFGLLAVFAINPFNIGRYALLLALVLLAIKNGKLVINLPVVLSIMLTLTVAVCGDVFFITWGVKMLIVSMLAIYIVDSNKTIEIVKTTIIFCTFLFTLQLFLSYLYNLSMGNMVGREFINFSTKELNSATGFAVLVTPIAALLPYYVFSGQIKERFVEFVIFVLCFAFGVIASFWLSGRSFFGIVGVTFACAFVYAYRRQKNKKLFLYPAIILAVLIIVAWFRYSEQINSLYEATNFYTRFNSGYDEIDYNPRSEIFSFYLSHLDEAFFGGAHIREMIGVEAHFLWLDLYDICGFLALLVFLIITYFSTSLIIRFCGKKGQYTFQTKLLLFCVSIAYLTQFCLEPVIEGSQWLVDFYWMIICMLYRCKSNKITEWNTLAY